MHPDLMTAKQEGNTEVRWLGGGRLAGRYVLFALVHHHPECLVKFQLVAIL